MQYFIRKYINKINFAWSACSRSLWLKMQGFQFWPPGTAPKINHCKASLFPKGMAVGLKHLIALNLLGFFFFF